MWMKLRLGHLLNRLHVFLIPNTNSNQDGQNVPKYQQLKQQQRGQERSRSFSDLCWSNLQLCTVCVLQVLMHLWNLNFLKFLVSHIKAIFGYRSGIYLDYICMFCLYFWVNMPWGNTVKGHLNLDRLVTVRQTDERETRESLWRGSKKRELANKFPTKWARNQN